MRRLRSHKRILPLCTALILVLSACFSPTPKGPNPLGETLSQTPASFTIQDGPFTFEKDVVTNPKKVDELTWILRKAKWRLVPSPSGASAPAGRTGGDTITI